MLLFNKHIKSFYWVQKVSMDKKNRIIVVVAGILVRVRYICVILDSEIIHINPETLSSTKNLQIPLKSSNDSLW